MQKVVRRVDLAKRQAARKKRIYEDTEAFRDKIKFNATLRLHNQEIAQAKRRARHLHREAWMLGDQSPLQSPVLANSLRYGAYTMNYAQPLPAKPKPDRRKNFYIAIGDRVCVVHGRDSIKGKIAKVSAVDEEADTVTLDNLNEVDINLTTSMTQRQTIGNFRLAEPMPVPVDDVRLVFPLPDPATGVPRDTILKSLEKKNEHFDVYKNKKVFDRYLEPQHVRIPWPEEDEPEYVDRDSDTLRIHAEEATFLPSLLRPPMPLGIIDELRNPHGRYRDRHDPEYIEKKMAEDEAREAAKERARRQLPRGARNIARQRWKSPDDDPRVHMPDNIAEVIGKHIVQRGQKLSHSPAAAVS